MCFAEPGSSAGRFGDLERVRMTLLPNGTLFYLRGNKVTLFLACCLTLSRPADKTSACRLVRQQHDVNTFKVSGAWFLMTRHIHAQTGTSIHSGVACFLPHTGAFCHVPGSQYICWGCSGQDHKATRACICTEAC